LRNKQNLLVHATNIVALGGPPVPEKGRESMARSPEAVVAAVAIGVVSAALGAGLQKRSSKRKSKKRQQRSGDEPRETDMLLKELFGDGKRMTVVVEAVGEINHADANAAADWETFSALMQLLGLVLSACSATCFLVVAIATGSFLLIAGAWGVAYFLAAPAAVAVRRHWGRALDEALDDSIKTTSAPWDLAVI
jgi:Flp pilus assembly protein TadB